MNQIALAIQNVSNDRKSLVHGSAGRIRTSNLVVTLTLKLLLGVDYIFIVPAIAGLDAGCIVSEPSRHFGIFLVSSAADYPFIFMTVGFPTILPVFSPMFPLEAAVNRRAVLCDNAHKLGCTYQALP